MSTDWAALYRANVEAVAGLAGDLSNEQLSARVPATPDWDVHDVLSHMAGGASDLVHDRMEGAPSPEWTQAHVTERSARSPKDLAQELRDHADGVAAKLADAERPAIVWDLVVHHADLHEALGLGAMPEDLWLPVFEAVASMRLAEDAEQVRAAAPSYELFRALFSRRSRGQLAGWDVPGYDGERLAELGIFGAREDDQPVPA
jgi:uncharacterized protein (TIGR03083 family)